MKIVLTWIVQKLITILISKNYGKKWNGLIQSRENKSKRRGKIRNRMREVSRVKNGIQSEEEAKTYIENMIDWDMLVTIVGQLSEHIAEKK